MLFTCRPKVVCVWLGCGPDQEQQVEATVKKAFCAGYPGGDCFRPGSFRARKGGVLG